MSNSFATGDKTDAIGDKTATTGDKRDATGDKTASTGDILPATRSTIGKELRNPEMSDLSDKCIANDPEFLYKKGLISSLMDYCWGNQPVF